MASVSNSPQAGSKKSLDAEINLVPFIDLLSMCICFLLMTAVWVEMGSIELKQALGTSAAETTSQSYDVVVKFSSQNSIVEINRGGQLVKSYPINGGEMNDKLSSLTNIVSTLMQTLNSAATDPNVIPDITGRVFPDKSLSYVDLISIMDVLRSNGVARLGVVPVKVAL